MMDFGFVRSVVGVCSPVFQASRRVTLPWGSGLENVAMDCA